MQLRSSPCGTDITTGLASVGTDIYISVYPRLTHSSAITTYIIATFSIKQIKPGQCGGMSQSLTQLYT